MIALVSLKAWAQGKAEDVKLGHAGYEPGIGTSKWGVGGGIQFVHWHSFTSDSSPASSLTNMWGEGIRSICHDLWNVNREKN